MIKLLLATNNQGKLAELRILLSGLNLELLSPNDLNLDIPAAALEPEVSAGESELPVVESEVPVLEAVAPEFETTEQDVPEL